MNGMLTRSPTAYAGLFFVSAPAWWLFELINLRTQNWIYLGETQGRGKLDIEHTAQLPKKAIWVYPLVKDFRRQLCS